MANPLFDTSLVWEGQKTWAEYYAQFDTPKTLEIGKTYYDAGPRIRPRGEAPNGDKWLVVALHGEVALACVDTSEQYPGLHPKGRFEYRLFYAKGPKLGWWYQDNRPEYRLRKEA